MNNTDKIIENIKRLKKENGYTNETLSKLSGVPLGTLNKILSGGVKSVKVETITKLENCFTVKTEMDNDYGFVKVGAYSIDLKICDIAYNLQQIKNGIALACEKGVQVLAFPSLCLVGSTIGDLFFQQLIIDESYKALMEIVNYTCSKDILVFIGIPLRVNFSLYNVSIAISNGKILGITPKTNLTSSEKRYFSSYTGENILVDILGESYLFGTKIIYSCKNRQNVYISCELGEDLESVISPSCYHVKGGSSIVVNLASYNEELYANEKLKKLVSSHSQKLACGYVVSNPSSGESTTDMVFSGYNLIADSGEIISESQSFSDGLIYSDIDIDNIIYERGKSGKCLQKDESFTYIDFTLAKSNGKLDRKYNKIPFLPTNDYALITDKILTMQAMGLVKRMTYINAKTLVIGVSGGLDSTLALLVCERAIKIAKRDMKDILAVTLPCFGTSKRTKSNAIKLMEELGVTIKEIDISKAVEQHFIDIGQDKNVSDVTFENSQARERTQVLMDLANKTGGMVIGTGDLSELALGFCTYNGDQMSNYSVNGSIPKTVMRIMIECESKKRGGLLKEVLKDIVETPVSPELLPVKDGDFNQKTEDIVGPYILHDFFLYYVMQGYTPSKIYYICKNAFSDEFSTQTIKKWLINFYKRFFSQQFKRSAMPDGVKVLKVSLSPRGEWAMPSDATSKLWLADLENIE